MHRQIGTVPDSLFPSWGTPDLVINNAAIINPNMPLWEVPYSDFSNLVQVNINGVFSVIRHIMPYLIEQHHGVIANLSSGWGRSMLQSCFGSSADQAPTPRQWAETAAPFFLNLSVSDNGKSLSV